MTLLLARGDYHWKVDDEKALLSTVSTEHVITFARAAREEDDDAYEDEVVWAWHRTIDTTPQKVHEKGLDYAETIRESINEYERQFPRETNVA